MQAHSGRSIAFINGLHIPENKNNSKTIAAKMSQLCFETIHVKLILKAATSARMHVQDNDAFILMLFV